MDVELSEDLLLMLLCDLSCVSIGATLGIVVAAGIAAGALAFAMWARSMPLRPTQCFFYALNVVISRTLWRAKISGPLPIAPDCGAVVVSNHRSPVDPCFIELATRRAVHWMVAKEYCEHVLFGRFLRMAEVIPTTRAGVDTAATRMAIRYTQQGGVIGLFPEGRINTTDNLLLPGRLGAALIALTTRVPVIPCYIQGSPYRGSIVGAIFTPAKVRLIVGQPIDLSEFYGREKEREVLDHLTRVFLKEIAKLAGQPDFEPEIAGRSHKPTSDADAAT
jgi:1-acyl-sn-glycerol-3-phosphate acyltransferase